MIKRLYWCFGILFFISLVVFVSLFICKKRFTCAYSCPGFYDWTVSKPKECNNPLQRKTWLISYASLDGFISSQQFLALTGARNCFKKFIMYNKEDLSDFTKENRSLFKEKKGDGYWSWKPYVILKALETIPEGDIVFYADSATVINGLCSSVFKIFEDPKNSIVLFSMIGGHTHGQYTKKAVLDYFNMNTEEYRNKPQIMATVSFFRNDKRSREFVKKWLDLATKKELIDDSPSKGGENPEFKTHRHDQSLLGMLALSSPEGVVLGDNNIISLSYGENKDRPDSDIIFQTRKKNINKSLLHYLNLR